jgi:hypothetical protein
LERGFRKHYRLELEIWVHSRESEATNMKNVFLAIIVALSLTRLGTAGTQTPEAGTPHHADIMQNCPMIVPGSDVSVTDVEKGIALTFTANSGDVTELRRRVEAMAQMHSTSSNAAMHRNMMPFSVKYEAVAGGARLTLTPTDPAQLEAFRKTVRQHMEQMKKGDCSMMQEMMRGEMRRDEGQTPTPEPKPRTEEENHSAHHPPGDKK